MTELKLVPYEEVLYFVEPHAEARAMRDDTSATGWKVTKKKGAISGVGVSVSGAGAWAQMEGNMSFEMRKMESSTKYSKMVNNYKISGGVSGFWAWISGERTSEEKKDIRESLEEMKKSSAVGGTVHVKLTVSGIYPNVQVDASAYMLVLQITDDQGSTVNVVSGGAPGADVGAQDENGQKLPTDENESTISF